MAFIAATAAATTAHAGGAYVDATGGAFAGAGFEGLTITAAGVDVATGYRLSRVFSIEGIFGSWFATQPYQAGHVGAWCSGEWLDDWHWQTFGVRLWTHPVATRRVDFAIAPPWLAGGAAFDHGRSLYQPGDECYALQRPRDRAGAMIVFGLIAFALDVTLSRHVALRLTTGAEIDLAQDAGIGVLAISASAGPVVRF